MEDKNCKVHSEKLDKLEKEVFGNGKDSIRVILAKHGTQLKLSIAISVLILSGLIGIFLK